MTKHGLESSAVRHHATGVRALREVRALLAAAYAHDPLMTWIFPDADRRPDAIAAWLGLFAETYLAAEEVDAAGAGAGSRPAPRRYPMPSRAGGGRTWPCPRRRFRPSAVCSRRLSDPSTRRPSGEVARRPAPSFRQRPTCTCTSLPCGRTARAKDSAAGGDGPHLWAMGHAG